MTVAEEPCTTTITVYPYFHFRRRGSIVPLLPTAPVYDFFHYERPENVYFPYTASNSNPSDNARFEGITPRRPPVNECMCDV